MFSVGDSVLHPLHGAGKITSISIKQNGEKRQRYYAVHLILDDVAIYVPIACSDQIGLRSVCGLADAERILYRPWKPLPPQPHNWSNRYRENMNRIRSGKIDATAQVVACLWLKNRRRVLAGSEKRMMECAEKILYSELMLVTGLREDEIRRTLEAQWDKLCNR